MRAKLTGWYALVLAAIIAGLGGFVVVQLRADLRSVVDRELRGRADALAGELEEEAADEDSTGDALDDFREHCNSAAPGTGTAALLLARGGTLLTSCGDGSQPAVPPSAREAATAGEPRLVTVPASRGPDRWRASLTPLKRGRTLVVAESLREVDEAVDRVLILLLLAGPAALIATAIGGWVLARQALRPVVRMTHRAQEIGIDRLNERIPVPATADEIADLGRTLNAMLDRLERGVDEKHRLVADASHELRTPVAVMRAELDVTLRDNDLPRVARVVLESAREEIDRMSRTVDNLMTLAQVDEGRLELLTRTVDLREAIDAAATPLLALAAVKDVRIAVDGAARPVTADPQRLQQALTNLIENAIKFSPTGGEVRVTAWDTSGEVGVTVTDDGPGVPAHAGEMVFDRFYRADGARKGPAGSGLGLAICREVVTAHGGRVWVKQSPRGGSAFSLALPTETTSRGPSS